MSEGADALRAEAFDRFEGGVIARHYPQPNDIALSREFHAASYAASL